MDKLCTYIVQRKCVISSYSIEYNFWGILNIFNIQYTSKVKLPPQNSYLLKNFFKNCQYIMVGPLNMRDNSLL